MALSWNGQLFQDFKTLVDEHISAVAQVLTDRASQQTFGTTVLEATERVPEHDLMLAASHRVYGGALSGEAAVQGAVVDFALDAWLKYAVRYLTDNGNVEVSSRTLDDTFVSALVGQAYADAQTIDASVPTAGAVSYDVPNNQGNGTATIAINSDTTLAELALAGDIILECLGGSFAQQNAEPWVARWYGVNPRTGEKGYRTSQSRNFVTGTRYYDVQSSVDLPASENPDPRWQRSVRGQAIHTGLNILVSTPSYDDTSESGDTDLAYASYSLQKVDGAKSNVTKRNSTFTGHASNRHGAIYLRTIKDGANYSATWYKDSGFVTALTETLVFTAATAGTQTWKAAATNPEHQNFGGHLTTASNFISATVTGANFTASTTVTLLCYLPWGRGDKIFCPITNAYGGKLARFLVQELGFCLPVNSAGGETITDP